MNRLTTFILAAVLFSSCTNAANMVSKQFKKLATACCLTVECGIGTNSSDKNTPAETKMQETFSPLTSWNDKVLF